jgi:hypothetical protein
MATHVRQPRQQRNGARIKGLQELGKALETKIPSTNTPLTDKPAEQKPRIKPVTTTETDMLQLIQEVGTCCSCGTTVFGGFYGRHGVTGSCSEKCDNIYKAMMKEESERASAQFEARIAAQVAAEKQKKRAKK